MISFEELENLKSEKTPQELVSQLVEALREQKDFNSLFDALLLQARLNMGLPLARPTSFEGVPQERQEEFEEQYISAAKEVGEMLLEQGNLPQATLYLRTIGEESQIKNAFDTLDPSQIDPEEADELINLALYENIHPIKGLDLMLKTRGTCNTITACDQAMGQLSPEHRTEAARLLVNHLYEELRGSLLYAIERHDEQKPESAPIRELLQDRDWLFAEGNYHVDVSHLHSVVRFARFLEATHPEMKKAVELSLYGSKLDEPFQYPAEAPFEEYYPAHLAYFAVLLDDDREKSLAFFKDKIENAVDPQDASMSAYVLVDLLCRIGEHSAAVDIAKEHLRDIEDPNGFSFSQLCQQAGDFATLKETAKQRNDLVTFAVGLLGE